VVVGRGVVLVVVLAHFSMGRVVVVYGYGGNVGYVGFVAA
jgi:hypothetical protein